MNATDPTGMATCANDDCSKAYIDSEINQGPAAIDSSLQGDPNGQSALVTFENDVKGGPSTDNPVDTETALTVEQGIRESGVSSVNVNSTTGGHEDKPSSNHNRGRAVDIDKVNGRSVGDPAAATDVANLQGAMAEQPAIRENLGPARMEKTWSRGGKAVPHNVGGHKKHVHFATQPPE